TPSAPLARLAVPSVPTPMRLFCTRLAAVPLPLMRTPSAPLPEITLREAAAAPPTVLAEAPRQMPTPAHWLGTAAPEGPRPMRLPARTFPLVPALRSSAPYRPLPDRTLPLTWLPDAPSSATPATPLPKAAPDGVTPR